MRKPQENQPVAAPERTIESKIATIRGTRVLLDLDLAAIYGVSTKALNQAVKRNGDRFPGDFMFRLTSAEKAEVVTNCDHLRRLKFSPVLPYAFSEHGAIMAANVLNSPQAVSMSVFVVRAFVQMRELLGSTRELARQLAAAAHRPARRPRGGDCRGVAADHDVDRSAATSAGTAAAEDRVFGKGTVTCDRGRGRTGGRADRCAHAQRSGWRRRVAAFVRTPKISVNECASVVPLPGDWFPEFVSSRFTGSFSGGVNH